MTKPIQSAWWVVYYIAEDSEPRFLLIKRHALSKRIERVAPKGKIEKKEKPEQTAIREITEEIGVSSDDLILQEKLWEIVLSLHSEERWDLDKEIIYYLVKYNWDPDKILITQWEGYLGYYKWWTIQEVMWLIYYMNLREIFRTAYNLIKEKNI